jgi:biotin synthase
MVAAAKRAKQSHAWKFCIVIASRGPDGHDMDVICRAVEEIKSTVKINVCTSLGILNFDQAKRLKAAGVDRFNHNLESSPRYFPKICSTHTYQDRLNTIDYCKKVCMGTCSGGIAGMGETDEDVVDLAFECKRLGVDSIPVNFLNPIEGTPFGNRQDLTPQKCLKILALFRLVNPTKDIRVAGGREYNLRTLQPHALKVVNSMFTDGYLTTPGKSFKEDWKMIREQGCEIVEP